MGFVGKFFLLVLTLGFAELTLLVRVSNLIGFWSTLGLCVLTGVLGGALVRFQGLRTFFQIQRKLASGELPTVDIVSGVVLLLSGALLITPGFLSDTIGFLLLLPLARRWVARWLIQRFQQRMVHPGFPSVVWGPVARAGDNPGAVRVRIIDLDP